MAPTVFANTSNDMRINREQMIAPITAPSATNVTLN
ncbi:hypothetical protein [Tateyamaria omphalii]|nr:hypothetical protein [Tateyamaria omphalii]